MGASKPELEATARRVRDYFMSEDCVRRGICLLNASRYDEAVGQFSEAQRLNPNSSKLRDYLARCFVGQKDYSSAAVEMRKAVERDPDDITARIRHALLIWKSGDAAAAVASLRRSVVEAPDCAELHFQLGTMLASTGDQDEAVLRFTQAVTLDHRHAEAMVALAMCHAADDEPARAVKLLTSAQSVKPHDARIGQLLSLAMKAANVRSGSCASAPVMPEHADEDNESTIAAFERIVEADPDFVDAFLSLPTSDVDAKAHAILETAVERALCDAGRPAQLHYQHSRLLDRLGRIEEALSAIENSLRIDPTDVSALIASADLHEKTGDSQRAVDRLESVLRLGKRYPDVYVRLGNLLRATGDERKAREAYGRAVEINEHYVEARLLLQTIGD